MTIALTINDRTVEVPDGASVLDAVNASETYISQLCKDPDMKPIGACRTCLVQIDGTRGFPTSCSVQAQDGMVVHTDTLEVRRVRSGVIELTMAMLPASPGVSPNDENPPGPPFVNGDWGDFAQLTTAAEHHGIQSSRWQSRGREKTDESNHVFNISMEACILCGRCAQACQDGHQFIGAIDFLGSGRTSRIGAFHGPALERVHLYHLRPVSFGLPHRRNPGQAALTNQHPAVSRTPAHTQECGAKGRSGKG